MAKERKNPWFEKSIENILPLSHAKDFKIAFSEWAFTGDVIDYEEAQEKCELCEHEELRYHFKIDNAHTKESLWVGSSCILRFEDIVVFDENKEQVFAVDERRRVLDKALKLRRINVSLEPLRKLWRINFERRDFIFSNAQDIQNGYGINPESLKILFKELQKFDIEFKPEQYHVNLRTGYYQYQLLTMDENDQILIWKAMSAQQRKKYKGRMKFSLECQSLNSE